LRLGSPSWPPSRHSLLTLTHIDFLGRHCTAAPVGDFCDMSNELKWSSTGALFFLTRDRCRNDGGHCGWLTFFSFFLSFSNLKYRFGLPCLVPCPDAFVDERTLSWGCWQESGECMRPLSFLNSELSVIKWEWCAYNNDFLDSGSVAWATVSQHVTVGVKPIALSNSVVTFSCALLPHDWSTIAHTWAGFSRLWRILKGGGYLKKTYAMSC
jgi:hypothetical protein